MYLTAQRQSCAWDITALGQAEKEEVSVTPAFLGPALHPRNLNLQASCQSYLWRFLVTQSQSRQKDMMRMNLPWCLLCCPSCEGTPQAQGSPAFPGGVWERWPATLILPISAAAPSAGMGLKVFYSSTAARTPAYRAESFTDQETRTGSFPLPPQQLPLLHQTLHSSSPGRSVCVQPPARPPPAVPHPPQPSTALPNHWPVRQRNNSVRSSCFVVQLTSALSSYLCLLG